MLVELSLVHTLGDAVEVREQIRRELAGLVLTLLRGAKQIVDQYLRVDLLLNVERWSMNDEIAPILLILPAPHELGIKVPIAPFVGHADGADLALLEYRLMLGSWNILPLGLVVL